MRYLAIITLVISIAVFACKGKKVSKKEALKIETTFTNGQMVYIYKTKAVFDTLVPVIMDESKTAIISYPAPSDLQDVSAMLPVKLKKGFLLDRKGIQKNTVFLKMGYNEYANLKEAPSLKEMEALILEKNPFESIYNCGNSGNFNNLEAELNAFIKYDLLKTKAKQLL